MSALAEDKERQMQMGGQRSKQDDRVKGSSCERKTLGKQGDMTKTW